MKFFPVTAALAAAALACASGLPAHADEAPAPAPTAISTAVSGAVAGETGPIARDVAIDRALDTQLDLRPGGRIVEENRIVYPDGSGFVAEQVSTLSVSQCDNTWFCMWSSTNYTGSFAYRTGPGLFALTNVARSAFNNRANASRLFNNANTGSSCWAPREQRNSLVANFNYPSRVQLYTSTSC